MSKRPTDLLREKHFGAEENAAPTVPKVGRNGQSTQIPEQKESNRNDENEISFAPILQSQVLLDVDTVDAVCVGVKPDFYPLYKRHGYVFTFAVFSPERYCRQDLEMHVPFDPNWKSIPRSSKLYRLLCVALGRHPRKGEKLTSSTFLRQSFRCRISAVRHGPTAYSEIENLVERLTGNYSR